MGRPSTLRVKLDYVEEVHLSNKFRGMEQYDRLQKGFFTGRGLHYMQDLSFGGLQAWMNKHGCQHGNTFFRLGEFSRSQFS